MVHGSEIAQSFTNVSCIFNKTDNILGVEHCYPLINGISLKLVVFNEILFVTTRQKIN